MLGGNLVNSTEQFPGNFIVHSASHTFANLQNWQLFNFKHSIKLIVISTFDAVAARDMHLNYRTIYTTRNKDPQVPRFGSEYITLSFE